MRNRETDRQADRQTGEDEYKHIMNIVRRKKRQRERGFIVLLRGEHTYPVRLNQKDRGGGG